MGVRVPVPDWRTTPLAELRGMGFTAATRTGQRLEGSLVVERTWDGAVAFDADFLVTILRGRDGLGNRLLDPFVSLTLHPDPDAGDAVMGGV